MAASDSPGTTTALAFADARMRFLLSIIWVREGLAWSAGDGDWQAVYLLQVRLDGWEWGVGSAFGVWFAWGIFHRQ